jgi:hypothetical protein
MTTEEAFSYEVELTTLTPFKFRVRCSIGFVTFSITSSGAAPGYTVVTLTMGTVMSGKVSIFIFMPEYNPANNTISVKIHKANLLFSENLIMLFKRFHSLSSIYTLKR